MADDEVRGDAASADRLARGQACRDERGLLDLRLDHLVERRVETKLPQVESRRLAALVENGSGLRGRLHDLTAHAFDQRALAGEHEGDLGHAAAFMPAT